MSTDVMDVYVDSLQSSHASKHVELGLVFAVGSPISYRQRNWLP